MLKINQILQGTIQSLDEQGNGILQAQRDCVLVKQVLLQEQVKVKVIKKIKEGYVGSVVEVVKKHPHRVKPACGIYEKCGSCHYLHMDYNAQLELKKKQLVEQIKKSKVAHMQVADVMGMAHPFAYRNKIIVGFSKDRNRRIQAGFYEEYSHNIIPFTHCLLHDEHCDAIIQSIVQLMGKMRIEPYMEDRRSGILRHVLLRKAYVTGEIMVVLVVNQNVFPGAKNFVSALVKQHPQITTVIQNINTRKTSVVLGNQERILYGKGFIEDVLCGYRFRISATSFYQINHDQCERLYEQALALCELTGKETLLDAYCGIGTIGMCASAKAKQVIGVELNKDAVQDAKKNAEINGIKNIRFICEDASAYMAKCAAKKDCIDVVIMDPPRSGSTKQFMDAIAKLKPSRVVYISCDPRTQIRDLEYFKQLGYRFDTMFLTDLFPNTMHVESIVKLVRTK